MTLINGQAEGVKYPVLPFPDVSAAPLMDELFKEYTGFDYKLPSYIEDVSNPADGAYQEGSGLDTHNTVDFAPDGSFADQNVTDFLSDLNFGDGDLQVQADEPLDNNSDDDDDLVPANTPFPAEIDLENPRYQAAIDAEMERLLPESA